MRGSARSRNYKYEQEPKLAKFFLYVYNGKKIKELFASILNGMTASVRCVSSIIVVLKPNLSQLIAAYVNKKAR